MVEIWQCNAAGKYIHPNDTTTRRSIRTSTARRASLTDESGAIELRTIKPGAYPVPDSARWWRPPHIHFSVWGRVWLSRLVTQMFFPGEPLNESDRILNAIRDRRGARAAASPGARRRPRDRRTRSSTSTSSWCAARSRRPQHERDAACEAPPTGEMTLGPFFPRDVAPGANDLTRRDGRTRGRGDRDPRPRHAGRRRTDRQPGAGDLAGRRPGHLPRSARSAARRRRSRFRRLGPRRDRQGRPLPLPHDQAGRCLADGIARRTSTCSCCSPDSCASCRR